MTSVFIGIFWTDPAMLRSDVPKSGISIMAGSSPATRNNVRQKSGPFTDLVSTVPISGVDFLDLDQGNDVDPT
jgi:hypothetical protein